MRQLLAAASLCLASTALAAGAITMDNNNGNDVIRCEGQDVTVNGNMNHITLAGERVTGNNNQVTWARALKGKRPSIANPGSHNTIAQSAAGGAGAAAAADATG